MLLNYWRCIVYKINIVNILKRGSPNFLLTQANLEFYNRLLPLSPSIHLFICARAICASQNHSHMYRCWLDRDWEKMSFPNRNEASSLPSRIQIMNLMIKIRPFFSANGAFNILFTSLIYINGILKNVILQFEVCSHMHELIFANKHIKFTDYLGF